MSRWGRTAPCSPIAGEKLRGRADGDVLWHGTRRGQVTLAERKLQVTCPRVRSKAASKEVPVPAYERLSGDARMATRVRDILVKGVSTPKYESVLPEVAGTVGVSKSSGAAGTGCTSLLKRNLD